MTSYYVKHYSFNVAHDVMGDCRYRLDEQPSSAMTCNPYPSGKFITRCVVKFSTTEGAPLNLAWYSRAQLGGTPQRLFSGFITRNTISSIESELTIQVKKDTVTSCEGFSGYFCRVSYYNGTLLSESQEIYLFPRFAISNFLVMCDEQSIQSTDVAKCVDPQFSTAEPTTLSSVPTTTSPATATTLQPMTDPPSTITTLSPTSVSPLASTTPPLTTETVPATTEQSPTTTETFPTTAKSVPTTMTIPSTTKISLATTDNLSPTTNSSLSTTTSSLPTTKSSSSTESLPTMATHPSTTEHNSSPTTKDSPSTTKVPPLTTEASPTTMSSPLTTESSQTTTESLPPTTKTSPLTLTTPQSLPPLASQDASSASSTPQSPPPLSPTSPTSSDPTINDPSTESEIGSGGGFDDEALLFLTLGAAAFILILIGGIVFCLCLWSSQCRQCGYEICCSDELCCTCSCCLCFDDV